MKRLSYVQKCIDAGLSDQEFVACVLKTAEAKSEERPDSKNLVLKATMALVKLSSGQERLKYFSARELALEADTVTSPTRGLWPWLKDNADVVEKKPGAREYRIRKRYLDAMINLLPRQDVRGKKRNILELAGLGKEIWEGVDPDRYIREERPNWGG